MKRAILPLFCLIGSGAAAAQTLPLQDGFYSAGSCGDRRDIISDIMLFKGDDGTQMISPGIENGPEGICRVTRLNQSGKTWSGRSTCRMGARGDEESGSYPFSYEIVSATRFVTEGRTFRKCG